VSAKGHKRAQKPHRINTRAELHISGVIGECAWWSPVSFASNLFDAYGADHRAKGSPVSDVDAKEVTILRLGAAGGSLVLVGSKDHSGWRFQVRTDESTLLDLLTEEDAAGLSPTTAGPWVRSWHEALAQLKVQQQ